VALGLDLNEYDLIAFHAARYTTKTARRGDRRENGWFSTRHHLELTDLLKRETVAIRSDCAI
jgi:hypothetical protein